MCVHLLDLVLCVIMEMVVVAAVIVILALASLVVLVLLANKNPRLSGFRSISDPGFRLQTSSNIIVVLPMASPKTSGRHQDKHPLCTPSGLQSLLEAP